MFKSKIRNKSEINPCLSGRQANVKLQMTKHKSCHLSFVFCHSFVICVLSFVILASGCVSPREACKGFLGVSTKVLEDTRSGAIKKEFNFDLITCHNKIRLILKETGSYIYCDDLDKDMIAVYVSEEDTTPVGIFLTELNKRSTLIEISSPSTYGKETIAKTIFESLTTGTIKKQKEGLIDAGKNKDHKKSNQGLP
ncbi:MAG: hypothetical protein WC578_04710 [Candidatus Omnitrophota bacterium]